MRDPVAKNKTKANGASRVIAEVVHWPPPTLNFQFMKWSQAVISCFLGKYSGPCPAKALPSAEQPPSASLMISPHMTVLTLTGVLKMFITAVKS